MSLQHTTNVGPRRQWPKANADRWLSLAAAPTFAIMALLTAMPGGGPADVFCSAAGASPLGGMFPMYLLMCAFHSAPWLRLIGKAWRNATVASRSPRES
jgi:hypothetical protein